jgi:uncharacterized protein with PIN domain
MNITILTCPQCNAMVLSDAARCHVCDHVLNEQHAEPEQTPALPTDHAVAEDLETCHDCGETYRRGLVRCWNCGSFTRDDIRDAYQRMTSDPNRGQGKSYGTDAGEEIEIELAPVVTQRVGPWKVSALPVEPLATEEETAASDDDFSFELADSFQMTDAVIADRTEEEPAYYGLATPEAEEEEPEPEIPLLAQVDEATPTEIPSLEPTAPPERKPAAERVPAPEEALLQIAQEEEADVEKSKKSITNKLRGGFVVFCPMGCRVRVQDRHRGKAGRCPKCNAVFFVPKHKPKPKVVAATEEAGATAPAASTEKWRNYLAEVHLHQVVPQKLRIKPDSLLNEFQLVDVVFSEDGLLLVTLVDKPGFMGANLKKKPALRTAMQEHLRKAGVAEGSPAAATRLITREQLAQLVMAQPSPADVESLFGDIPVFGGGRIAVKLPRVAEDPATPYLSFRLSEFRQFVAGLAVAGVEGFGAETDVPVTESYNTTACHYSEAPVRELLAIDYYQKDPALPLKVVGWRCGGCGLVVSEDSRKKEKIGGLNGKGIASAKCPKCKAKFGKNPLYEVAPAAAPTPAPAAAPAS